MKKIRIEGIILQSLNFQDFDQILTVFTSKEGLIKLIVKGVNKKFTPSTPLTFSEFIYAKGKSDIYKCFEMSSLRLNLQLRNSFASLEAVYIMLKALLKMLPLHQPTPQLFSLFIWTLERISFVKDPHTLSLSFLLKLMRHEGIIHITPVCTQCQVSGQTVYFSKNGETFCAMHAPSNAMEFQENEMEKIKQLAFLSSLQDIKEMILEDSFRKKIHSLCENVWRYTQ